MSEKKLLFIDLDGTVIGHDQVVPPSAIAALKGAAERGHVLVMCTGRSVPEIYPYFWDFGFSGAVTGAGGYVVVGDEILVDRRLDANTIRLVSQVWESLGGLWIWQGPDEMNPSPGFMNYFLETAGLSANDWAPYAASIAPYVKEGLPASSGKVTAYLPADRTTPEEIRARIPADLAVTEGSVPAGDTLVYEVTPADVSKGTGLRLVAERLGFAIADTIAFGDSMNDVEALRAAGTAVAMGACSPALLEVADLVADRLEDDGLARAFAALGLID